MVIGLTRLDERNLDDEQAGRGVEQDGRTDWQACISLVSKTPSRNSSIGGPLVFDELMNAGPELVKSHFQVTSQAWP